MDTKPWCVRLSFGRCSQPDSNTNGNGDTNSNGYGYSDTNSNSCSKSYALAEAASYAAAPRIARISGLARAPANRCNGAGLLCLVSLRRTVGGCSRKLKIKHRRQAFYSQTRENIDLVLRSCVGFGPAQ